MLFVMVVIAAVILVASLVALHRLTRPAAAPPLVVRCMGSGVVVGSDLTRYGRRVCCRRCARGFHVPDAVVLAAVPEHEIALKPERLR